MYLVVEGQVTEFDTFSSIFVASRLKKPNRVKATRFTPKQILALLLIKKSLEFIEFKKIPYFTYEFIFH